MKIKEITQYLETIAPLKYQESYDNAGLIVGNPNAECTKALLCLDSTEAIVAEAIERGCNLIIAHHPIVFSGLKQLTGKTYIERTIIEAIKNDIAIYAAHTNLDNVLTGVNQKICDKLGLVNCSILRPKKGILKKLQTLCPLAAVDQVRNALLQAGAGQVGDYAETTFNILGVSTFQENTPNVTGAHQGEMKIETVYPAHLENQILQALFKVHPHEKVSFDIIALENAYQRIGAGMIGELEKPLNERDFLEQLKSKMKTNCVRYTTLRRKKVKKVAICGGAGSFLLNDAIAKGASVFVTADFKYHQFFDANSKIVIADIGHYESEQYTIELFQELLTEKFSNFDALLSKVNTNPIKYL